MAAFGARASAGKGFNGSRLDPKHCGRVDRGDRRFRRRLPGCRCLRAFDAWSFRHRARLADAGLAATTDARAPRACDHHDPHGRGHAGVRFTRRLGLGRVGRSVIADSGRYEAIYDAAVVWLESHDISVAGLWAEHFNVGWMLRWAQAITGRVNTTLSFWLITLVYVILGLTEVDDLRRKAQAFIAPEAARMLLSATADTARKFRKYMVVRTQMSLATGSLLACLLGARGSSSRRSGASSPSR